MHNSLKLSKICPNPLKQSELASAQSRTFRFSLEGEKSIDYPSRHGTVFIVPWQTNREIKHGIAFRKTADRGWRISITVRAFAETES